MDTKIVTIDLADRSYDIYIGQGLIYSVLDYLPDEVQGRKVFIICDSNVKESAQQIETIIKGAKSATVETYELKGGDSTKSLENVEKITAWMLAHKISRNSFVIAIGGGVIGDLAGFCASIVLRGVQYIQIPTTLLSQVDSSVGGKTGVNTAHGKNLIGSFYQPSAVIMDLEILKTLPKRELQAGYAEIVKYALIGDSGFFNWLQDNGEDVCNGDEQALSYAIETSVKAKAAIVESDEREESGRRALLNFGHTFGHAIEAAAGYNGTLLHGEAVAIGMVMVLELSCRMDLCEREDVERVEEHLSKMGLPIRASAINPALTVDVEALLTIMRSDKKMVGDTMNFILASAIGNVFLSDDVPENLVREILKESLDNDGRTEEGNKNNLKNRTKNEFKLKGVKGLWKSKFSSQS